MIAMRRSRVFRRRGSYYGKTDDAHARGDPRDHSAEGRGTGRSDAIALAREDDRAAVPKTLGGRCAAACSSSHRRHRTGARGDAGKACGTAAGSTHDLDELRGSVRGIAGTCGCARSRCCRAAGVTELELQAHWFAGDFGREFTATRANACAWCSSASGITRPGRTSPRRRFRSTAASRCAAASNSIPMCAIGSGTATRRIRLTNRRAARFHAARAAASFSPAPRSIAMCRKCCSILARLAESRRIRSPRRSPAVAARPAARAAGGKGARSVARRGAVSPAAQSRGARATRGIARRGRGALPGARRDARLQEQQAALHPARPTAPAAAAARGKADADALLFGVSGFLPPRSRRLRRADARYLRGSVGAMVAAPRGVRAACSIAPTLWQLSGQRPVNHPQRRLAALAQIVRHWPKIRALARSAASPRRSTNSSRSSPTTYWDFHYTVTSKTSARRMALVGESRVTEMLANVFFPLAMRDDRPLDRLQESARAAHQSPRGSRRASPLRDRPRKSAVVSAKRGDAAGAAANLRGLLPARRQRLCEVPVSATTRAVVNVPGLRVH